MFLSSRRNSFLEIKYLYTLEASMFHSTIIIIIVIPARVAEAF
jgi:hypothetical protein